LALYGVDLNHIEARTFATLDDAIADNYSHHFNWYRNVMQKAHFSELVRPVHPEFYVRNESAEKASVESAFTRTVMRIDPFLDLWNRNLPRWRSLAEIAGVEPVDAKTWRAFLRRMFDLAASNHALGIKQLQAYSRRLEFLPRKDTDVVWSGQLTSDQVIAFQDWVVHECCSLANDLGWPHQIHVGTNNLSQSSPLPLGALAKRYPRMKIVMIHCWPFLNEAGWLAKHHPNVYIDTCWQPILNPDFFRQSMRAWWEYVPLHKITCGHDATTVEMAFGSALYTREILADILPALTHASGWTAAELNQAVIDVLHNNAVSLYGVGTSKSLDKESI
jgi:hypothetical protein